MTPIMGKRHCVLKGCPDIAYGLDPHIIAPVLWVITHVSPFTTTTMAMDNNTTMDATDMEVDNNKSVPFFREAIDVSLLFQQMGKYT